MARVAAVLATAILLASIFAGLTGAPDILNTATIPQRAVGLTAAGYGLLAPVVLFAMWRARAWVQWLALLWAALFVTRGTLATIVYQIDRDPTSLMRTLSVATLLGIAATVPVLGFAWHTRRLHRKAVPLRL